MSVTVCIPTYNGAAHIRECLESVSSQTFDDIDILIVDDCSTDETTDVITHYQSQDSRVRFVRNPHNLGLMGNWQRCIELSNGDYIKFVFQDDVLYPRCIESLMDAMKYDVRFAFCAREFIFESGTNENLVAGFERGRKRIDALFAETRLISPESFCRAVVFTMPRNIVGEPTVTLMHRDALATYGRFNPDFLQILDLEYWCRIGTNEAIYYVPEVLAKFRLHPTSETSRNLSRRLYEAEVIDRLLLLHEFAFSPVFAHLRELARRGRPRINFTDWFYEESHWAVTAARERADTNSNRDSTDLEALKAAGSRYPAVVQKVPLQYGLARKWRSLKVLLGFKSPYRFELH